MMTWHLRGLEKAKLMDAHRQTKDGKSRNKIKVMPLIDKGYTLAETEVLLSIEENTVHRWKITT